MFVSMYARWREDEEILPSQSFYEDELKKAIIATLEAENFRYSQADVSEILVCSIASPIDAIDELRRGMSFDERHVSITEYQIGQILQTGKGIAEDKEEAARFYRKSADRGYPESQYALGSMHFLGEGVEQDYEATRMWWNKAAENGVPEAKANLAFLYSAGLGVSQSNVHAHMWWTLAQGNGSPLTKTDSRNSRKNLRLVEEKMSKEQIAEAQNLATEWREKHSR